MATGTTAAGWTARDSSGVLTSYMRKNGNEDVTIRILYCNGICHWDLHSIRNEWQNAVYPIVAGHEIVGIVTEVGCNTTKFKVGDMVCSCRSCDSCNQHHENYCPKMLTDGTYGSLYFAIVVNEHYVVKFPENLPLDQGPLLCAGFMVYSPMKQFGLNEPGKHIGVVGLSWLGRVAVKFGKIFHMKVTVIGSSPDKEKEEAKGLGADAFLISSNPEAMQAAMSTMDGIINAVSAVHSLPPLISLLKSYGKIIMLGLPQKPLELSIFSLISSGKIVAGSCIGGEDAQEIIDLVAKVLGSDY